MVGDTGVDATDESQRTIVTTALPEAEAIVEPTTVALEVVDTAATDSFETVKTPPPVSVMTTAKNPILALPSLAVSVMFCDPDATADASANQNARNLLPAVEDMLDAVPAVRATPPMDADARVVPA